MANDTLKSIGESVCTDYLGFAPTSNGTKPPHIANGLFRACLGETCRTTDVHEWLICEGNKDAISSDEIISSYHQILERGQMEKVSNIKDLRFLLYEIFNQDNTTYPSYDFSVMTISSHWMVKKRVSSEANIGDFIFEILSKKIDGKRSPAIELLQAALSNDTDDMTKLVKPIIAFPSEKEKREVSGVEFPDNSEIRWDSCKKSIRRGFDQLSRNLVLIEENKNSLLVLRRMVNYAVFASLLYLIHGNSAVFDGQRIPIVIDAGGELDSIKKASEQSFTAAKKSVEDYYVNAIYNIIDAEIPHDTVTSCKKWINEMVFNSADKEENVKNAITSYYDSFCAEGDAPKYALAKALQIALYTFEYKNNSPSDFCRVLGVRAGLVGPKGNRAKIKRYLVNSFTLETITLSAVSEDDLADGIELKDLSDKLVQDYCILIGGDSDTEYSILETANIAQSTPGDLRGDLSLNSQQLANTYISLGLGKRYADGVTLIGWRL
ncbi:MAG: hypothetical protein LUG45_04665 [Clostridiales bacterium]|nr:hypothetical protein [Clostridiales bacterium]